MKNEPSEFRHCWFSSKQSEIGGTSFYETNRGREFEVTDASYNNTPQKCFSRFDDLQYVGYGKWKRSGKPNRLQAIR